MQSTWQAIKRFFTAEEVPRWFGLSVVLIYLAGLGAVAQFGIIEARREGTARLRRSSVYATKLLVHRLAALEITDPAHPIARGRMQRALREFASAVTVRTLRVADAEGRIVASIDPSEVGTPAEAPPGPAGSVADDKLFEVLPMAVAGQRTDDMFIRARIPRHEAADEPDGFSSSPGALFVEARLGADPVGTASLADQARTLAVILVVLGALFVVYRCLRGQLRGVSCIASRLSTHGQRLAEELDALRIAETLDNVTTAWNSLIDLTKQLLEAAQQSSANDELSAALQRRTGSALAEALNTIPEGLIYITDESRVEYFNQTAARLLGVQTCGSDLEPVGRRDVAGELHLHGEWPASAGPGRSTGRRILDVVRGALRPDGLFENRMEVIQEGAAGDEETPPGGGGRGAGSAYRVQVTPVARGRRHGECIVLIRDVSQQLRSERAREEFIAQLTHELRTPLTNIRAYAETLSSGMFDDPKLITDCYNVITKETRRLSRLIEDILSVSQLEIASLELHVDAVDFQTLLTDAVRDVRQLADEKNIDLQLVLPKKMEPVRGDRDKLAVVLNNLLGNAIKYTPPGGNVLVGLQYTPDQAAVTVKDNGIGIEPSDQARIFDKFERGNDPSVKDQPGTGIGLYTAREIVRAHHGDIEVISEKGNGATFLVRLPRGAYPTEGRRAKSEDRSPRASEQVAGSDSPPRHSTTASAPADTASSTVTEAGGWHES